MGQFTTSAEQTSSRRTVGLVLIALALGGWAVYEHQHGAKLAAALAAANAQLAQQQQQATTWQQQLAAAKVQINDLAQKNMPISLIFRPANSGTGLVTVFKNNAPAPMDISVVMSNPVNRHSREAHLLIPANGSQSIGESEGWVFEPGQHIKLTHAQFGTVEYVITDPNVTP